MRVLIEKKFINVNFKFQLHTSSLFQQWTLTSNKSNVQSLLKKCWTIYSIDTIRIWLMMLLTQNASLWITNHKCLADTGFQVAISLKKLYFPGLFGKLSAWEKNLEFFLSQRNLELNQHPLDDHFFSFFTPTVSISAKQAFNSSKISLFKANLRPASYFLGREQKIIAWS